MTSTSISSDNSSLLVGGDFGSYHISHDGEPDDILALVIASTALKGRKVQVDCTIGNPDIVHASEDKDQEMLARILLTKKVFEGALVIPVAKSKDEISEQYVKGIIEGKKCLVLHTDSFKSLQALFDRAKPGQLQNVVILSYGSVNLSWALPKPENYQPFYSSLTASGAKLVQVEAFPFLGNRNKLTHKTTPLTYSLLEHLDGPVGQKWLKINANSEEKVRAKQAGKVAGLICKGMKQASVEQQETLTSLVSNIVSLLGSTDKDLGLSDPEKLQKVLNQCLVGEKHDRLYDLLNKLRGRLSSILKVKETDIIRQFTIYAKTTLKGQALIADQIPAIIFSEFVEKESME